MSVYITVSREEAEALSALLSGAMTVQVIGDLGLGKLQQLLSSEFDTFRIRNVGVLERRWADTPVNVVNTEKSSDVYIVTD